MSKDDSIFKVDLETTSPIMPYLRLLPTYNFGNSVMAYRG